MTLLSADDIAAYQAEFDIFRVEIARPLARAKQTTLADVWRNPDPSSGKRSAAVLDQTGILIHIAAPDARGMQLLADLGAQRANLFAECAWDVDITEGDELHVGDVVYQVERAAKKADMTLCAVWEVKTP